MKTAPKQNLVEISQTIHTAAQQKEIIFVSGNFNILHPGHLRLLQFAMGFHGFLVVAVQSDKIAGKSVWISEKLRFSGVQLIHGIDYVFLLDSPITEAIKAIKPDIVIKGKEHENTFNPEMKIVQSYGGEMIFSSGDVIFSSIDLFRRGALQQNGSNIQHDLAFMKRHDITNKKLNDLIDRFSNLKILVVGDTIVDEYILCDPVGLSREEPTIVVTPVAKECYIGAAAIVAEHAAALGAKTLFFSVTGKDDTAEFVSNELTKNKVKSFLFKDGSRPTTIKQRFRSNGKNLLRLNILRQHEISESLQQKILQKIIENLDGANFLIFSDFNYGCLPQWLVDNIEHECMVRHIPYAADSQSSSQIGDVSRYHNALLLTPTEHELRLAIQDSVSGIVVAAEKLRQKTNTQNIFVTIGAEGMFIHKAKQRTWQNDRLPAMNSNPKDVAGAGDSLLVAAVLTMAAGGDIWEAAYIGSVMAACQVACEGNHPLSQDTIKNNFSDLNHFTEF